MDGAKSMERAGTALFLAAANWAALNLPPYGFLIAFTAVGATQAFIFSDSFFLFPTLLSTP